MSRARLSIGAMLVGLGLAGCYLSHERARAPSPPRESDCGVALLGGSPAPMPGYCPSRANRSLFEISARAPTLRWRLALPDAVSTDSPIIVGPDARLYLTAASALIAIDDDATTGRIAWRADLGGPASPPVLLADGTVLVIVSPDATRREAVWLTADGSVSRRATLPDDVAAFPLVGADGALFFVAVDRARAEATLVALEADGTLRWSSEIRATAAELALGPGDRLVAATYLATEELSAVRDGWYRAEIGVVSVDGGSGEVLFEVTLDRDGLRTAGPALAADGTAYLTAWIDGHRQSALVAVSPDGAVRRTVLTDPPIGGGPSSIATSPEGLVVLKEGTALLAYDARGELVWQREVHLNVDLGGTLDPAGALLLFHGLARSDDGADVWISDIPAHREGDTTFFPGPMTVGDGVLYYLASDTQLWAVGDPL